MYELTTKFGPKESWSKMYEQGITPWNLNKPSPGIQKLLSENRIPQSGSFLVPGCGQGYDCFALVNGKREIYGVDLVKSVIEQDERVREERMISNTELKFVDADFFEVGRIPRGYFDFGFDYTFLCALHPSFREQWAKSFASYLKPGAMFVTLMYPLRGNDWDINDGPPYPLSLNVYHQLLDEDFTLESLEDVEPPNERRAGLEKLGVWIRKNTAVLN